MELHAAYRQRCTIEQRSLTALQRSLTALQGKKGAAAFDHHLRPAHLSEPGILIIIGFSHCTGNLE